MSHKSFFFSTVPIPKVECTTDRDCPSRQSCLQEKCKDPCLTITPCATNAECTVYNTLPLRTMSCTCKPGYTGKGDERCEKISKILFWQIIFQVLTLLPPLSIVIPEPIGCQSDQECSRNEACDNRNCINPCVTSNPCSSNAACYVENHRAKCRCPPGFTGDPFRQCVLSKFMHCFGYCQKAFSQTFHF